VIERFGEWERPVRQVYIGSSDMNSKKLKQLTIFSIILTVAIVILTVCVIQTVNDEQSSVSADTNSTLTSYNNPYTVSIKESEAFVVTQQYCWWEQEWGGGGITPFMFGF